MSRRPAAFLSYARSDDLHEKGRLTEFRDRLAGEVRMQTGEEFHIFQDRDGIRWGQEWKARLQEALDGVTFFIPILTPNFFTRQECRNELTIFLARENSLGRSDLVLPVYYVECPAFADPNGDELILAIASRQYVDWRELRFADFADEAVRRSVASLAHQIREALSRSPQAPRSKVGPFQRRPEPLGRKPPAVTRGSPKGTSSDRDTADTAGGNLRSGTEISGSLASTFDDLIRGICVGILRSPPLATRYTHDGAMTCHLTFWPSRRHSLFTHLTLVFVLAPLSQVSSIVRLFAAAAVADWPLEGELPAGFQFIFEGDLASAGEVVKAFISRALTDSINIKQQSGVSWLLQGTALP